jgi:hypothetical protein
LVAAIPLGVRPALPGSRPGSGLNAALTKVAPKITCEPAASAPARIETVRERHMDFDLHLAKTPATIDEIKARVAFALQRHPLCRNVEFDIVSMPRSSRGGNWTISVRSIASDALWEASDIVSDIQQAYELAVAA